MPSAEMTAMLEQRREARRSYLKSLKRGDMIVCDAPAGAVTTMTTADGVLSMRTPESEADRKEREHRAWEKRFEEKYLSGW
jgi:hypothetical protein